MSDKGVMQLRAEQLFQISRFANCNYLFLFWAAACPGRDLIEKAIFNHTETLNWGRQLIIGVNRQKIL